jgi:hypothetical protein
MNTLITILAYAITLGLAEAVIFILAAVLLGFSIHFYWFGRRSVPGIRQVFPMDREGISEDDEWRLQFYEQLEKHEKNQERLEKELLRMAEAEKILLTELEEARDEITRLEQLAEKKLAASEVTDSTKHISELMIAQQNLNEYLSKEMTERLEKAYQEFNFLQESMHKIQSQALDPQNRNLEHREIKESYIALTKEHDDLRLKHITLMEDNQKLTRALADAEDKLRDANFQKQQLGKKVIFLEDLLKDMQEMTAHHKKLEVQLKRISEIEGLLAKTANEARKP